MSLRVMSWAWSVQLAPTPKLVLMALADEADDIGFCFPSQRRLAAKCSITDRTVRRMLVELETKGYVTLERRHRADGSRTSNGYRLKCTDPPDKLSWGEDTDVRGSRTTVSRGSDIGVLRPTTHPLSNPTPRQRDVDAALSGETDQGAGARCVRDWEFPEALSAGQIAALRDELTGIEANRGQQVLDELAGRMRLGRISNPIRYCAVLIERAKCGQFRPELGIRIAEARLARLQYAEREATRTSADRKSIEASLQRLPNKLRLSLERMRGRTNDEDERPQGAGNHDDAPR
jgi:hypothetical protein